MIESHLALVYSTRGSATAWLNRASGLTLWKTYTLEQGERRGEETTGMICDVWPRQTYGLMPKGLYHLKTFVTTHFWFPLKPLKSTFWCLLWTSAKLFPHIFNPKYTELLPRHWLWCKAADDCQKQWIWWHTSLQFWLLWGHVPILTRITFDRLVSDGHVLTTGFAKRFQPVGLRHLPWQALVIDEHQEQNSIEGWDGSQILSATLPLIYMTDIKGTEDHWPPATRMSSKAEHQFILEPERMVGTSTCLFELVQWPQKYKKSIQ